MRKRAFTPVRREVLFVYNEPTRTKYILETATRKVRKAAEDETKPIQRPVTCDGLIPTDLDPSTLSLMPERQEYKQAEAVTFSVKIKNVWKKYLHIANTPTILVGPATISTNKYTSIAIPDFSNKTLKPGETMRSSVTWTQSGEPGWYHMEFGDIKLGNTIIGGGGGSFSFVKYPTDNIQSKTIVSGAKMKPADRKWRSQFCA